MPDTHATCVRRADRANPAAAMTLNDLLTAKSVDPAGVMVMRHRPEERELRKVLPWLAGEKPHIYNAFQRSHGDKVQKALTRVAFLASFIAHGGGEALFVGLYAVRGWKEVTDAKGYDQLRSDRPRGGNRLLRQRDPKNLRFTILQRVSPDMETTDVIRLEVSGRRDFTRGALGG